MNEYKKWMSSKSTIVIFIDIKYVSDCHTLLHSVYWEFVIEI